MPRTIEFYTVPEAAKFLGCNIKPVEKMQTNRQFPGAIWYDGESLIPLRDLQALMKLDANPELAGVPWRKAKEAIRKWSKLRQYWRLLQSGEYCVYGRGGTQLRREAARKIGVSYRTLQRWQYCIRLNGIRGLIDTRGTIPRLNGENH